MPLNTANANANANDTTSPFEDEAETMGAAGTVNGSAGTGASPAVTQNTGSTIAVQSQGQNALSVQNSNVLATLKNAFVVDYDSLPRIVATQGSFAFKDTEEDLGDTVVIDLISYQDGWVCSPNDTKAPVELVKFSPDGITARDGTNLQEHLQYLKDENHRKASITKRMVIAGELVRITEGKKSDRVEQLVQIDLPPTGVSSFNAHLIQASYAVGKQRKSAQEAKIVTVKAVKDKNKAGDAFTKCVFSF